MPLTLLALIAGDHRGRITKQGSTLVRWAAVEAVQRISEHHRLGQIRDQVGCRRGRNIGVVANRKERSNAPDRGMDRPEVRVPVAGYILARDGRHCMITIGIDPHKSSLTAVAVEVTGKSVATMRIAITVTAVRQLQEWAAC